MNDQQLLDALVETRMPVNFIAELVGCSRQNVYPRSKEDRFFTPERLITLYDHLRNKDSSNLQALSLISQALDQRWPALRNSDRHLIELSPEPWRKACLMLPDKSWLDPMLLAMSHDRRIYPCQRELRIVLPHADFRNIQRACLRHFNLRYSLTMTLADLPALMPPMLILNDAQVLTLGDQELRPITATVAKRQIQAAKFLLANAKTSNQALMEGGAQGKRQPGASDGDQQIARFDTPNDRFELALERMGDGDQWRMEFRALSDFQSDQTLRIIDQAGQIWLETSADYLPWQGRRDFAAQDPAPLLNGLSLELLESQDDEETE